MITTCVKRNVPFTRKYNKIKLRVDAPGILSIIDIDSQVSWIPWFLNAERYINFTQPLINLSQSATQSLSAQRTCSEKGRYFKSLTPWVTSRKRFPNSSWSDIVGGVDPTQRYVSSKANEWVWVAPLPMTSRIPSACLSKRMVVSTIRFKHLWLRSHSLILKGKKSSIHQVSLIISLTTSSSGRSKCWGPFGLNW